MGIDVILFTLAAWGAPIAAALAPFVGAAVTPLMAGIAATAAGAGSAIAGTGAAAGAATNPFIVGGVQNAGATAFNNTVGSVANAVNGMNLPGIRLNVR